MTVVNVLPPNVPHITPHLIVRGASKALEFYASALGATEISRMPIPGTDVLAHAEMKLGNAFIFLADEFPEHGARSPLSIGGSPVTIHLYVDDVDAVFNRFVAAGGTVQMPPENQFWGDRYCKVTDPFGHSWSLATRIENLTPEELAARGEKAMAEMMSSQKC